MEIIKKRKVAFVVVVIVVLLLGGLFIFRESAFEVALTGKFISEIGIIDLPELLRSIITGWPFGDIRIAPGETGEEPEKEFGTSGSEEGGSGGGGGGGGGGGEPPEINETLNESIVNETIGNETIGNETVSGIVNETGNETEVFSIGDVRTRGDITVANDGEGIKILTGGGLISGGACVSNVKCEEWSECHYAIKTKDILKSKLDKAGYRKRECTDENRCVNDFVEESGCEIPDVKINVIEEDGEEYIIIKDEQGRLVAKVKVGVERLDIIF